jgi:D-glycero-D-manno-heptose 1,7-bisphosphate phosphatase
MSKAAFLDRDGVINRKAPEGLYITRWEDLHFLPGVAEAIALLNAADFRVIVVSNQRCVAKGMLTARELESMHRRMADHLARAGAIIDAIYYCPHELQPVCSCRKPAPGMLLQAAREHHVQLADSWMIGDSEIDIEAGKKAACKTARLLDKSKKDEAVAGNCADLTAASLLDAVQQILAQDPASAGSRATEEGRSGDLAQRNSQMASGKCQTNLTGCAKS